MPHSPLGKDRPFPSQPQATPIHEPDLPPAENRKFYPALDGLRAAAVLLVFFHHYRPLTWHWLSWGWVGVDAFFVLSGFLITGILYDTRHLPRRFRTFYARRTLRIFPLYYALCVLVLALTPLLQFRWSPRWILWPLYLGNYTHLAALHAGPQAGLDWLEVGAHANAVGSMLSFGHLWSLSVEEQFYLVWPLVVYSVQDRKRLLRLCVLVVLALPLLRSLAFVVLPRTLIQHELLYRSTFFRCDALLLGAALALLLRGNNPGRLLQLALPLLCASVALCVVIGYCAVHLFHAPSTGLPTTPWISTIGFTLVDFAAAALLLLVIQPETPLARLLNLAPLRALGRISYGFYVFHDIFHARCIQLGAQLYPRGGQRFGILIALCLTLLLSATSYRLFEKPFLKLKRHFT